jgi:FkbM family methyltransferase
VLTIHHAAKFITRGLKARYRDTALELGAIHAHVLPTDTVCDVGANKGSFTFWLAQWCRLGRVVSFEPQPEIASQLAADCRTMHFGNVIVEPIGVYSETGTQILTVPYGHSPAAALNGAAIKSDSDISYPVPVVSLDDYFSASDRISAIKIDVEGAELHVLKGAERIVKKDKPLIVMECEARQHPERGIEHVLRHLESLGYRGRFVFRGKMLPASDFDASVHQREDGEWFWKSKDYVHNFIFSPT